jgi:hypothetical protein
VKCLRCGKEVDVEREAGVRPPRKLCHNCRRIYDPSLNHNFLLRG